MARHPHLDRSHPEVWRDLMGMSTGLGAALEAAQVPRSTVELLNLRVSQLNGCSFCVHVHSRRAQRAGVGPEHLAQIAVWRESPAFSERERAALEIAEVVTLLPPPAEREPILDASRELLGDEAATALEWAAIAIGAFNRVSIISGHPVPLKPGGED